MFARLGTVTLIVLGFGCSKKEAPPEPESAPPRPEPKLVYELDRIAVPMTDAKTALLPDGSVLVVVGKGPIACEALMPIEPALGEDFVGFYTHLIKQDGDWAVGEIWSQPHAFDNHRNFNSVIVHGDPAGTLSVKLDLDLPSAEVGGETWHHMEVHGTVETTPCGKRENALPR